MKPGQKNKLSAWEMCLSALIFASPNVWAAENPPQANVSAESNWPKPVEDQLVSYLLLDQLEYRSNRYGGNTIRWDAQGWIGNGYNKLWVKTEGDRLTARASGSAEVQALYSRLIAPFWDLQMGLRYDRRYGGKSNPSQTYAVIGVQGLAPYQFDLEPALFISQDGDISARFTGTYDLRLTQRLIAQPRLEVNAASRRVQKFDIGSGMNDIALGLRVRYEIKREFAPYVGISWSRKLGNTADIARTAGEHVDNFSIVAGVRLWF
jgi:copper resistance protein B